MILLRTRRLIIALGAVVLLLAAPLLLRLIYPLHYADEIRTYAHAHGMDPHLIAAVIRVESRFEPRSQSAKGARGLMQIMPETGAWVASQLGLEDFTPDDLYDPDINIRIGTWYLADLRETFAGDVVLMLAAYNGGRTNVRRWLEQHDLAAGDLADRLERIPFTETRRFVERVLLAYRMYRLLYPQLAAPPLPGDTALRREADGAAASSTE